MSSGGDRPREARTHFEVERFLDGFTLVRVRLETGRTHQIRAHFAAIGHPLVRRPRVRRHGRCSGLERQFLHSARLALRATPGAPERDRARSRRCPRTSTEALDAGARLA